MRKPAEHHDNEARSGVFLGILAYTVWGFFPAYFKALAGVPPLEVVCHRIVWSLVFLVLVITARRRWQEVRKAFSCRKTLLTLTATTVLIATNWLVFIYAVERGEVLQSSLGYFVTPLVSVFLGYLFLHERLRPLQLVSLVFAMIGVLAAAIHYGSLPWIALLLAFTFGLYGLLRKIAAVSAMTGLTVETILAGPPALLYLLALNAAGTGTFLSGPSSRNVLLPLAGIVTAVPLIWFAAAARRLRLTTIGFLQYITPSLHFLLAVLAYGEEFSSTTILGFLAIWCGLALFSYDAVRCSR